MIEDYEIVLPQIQDGEDKSSPLVNRIRKNYRHLRKWAKRTLTDCFRLYDSEIRHYPVTIDFYRQRFCISYFSRSVDDETPPGELFNEVNAALISIFGTTIDHIHWKTRAKTKLTRQYEKRGESRDSFVVTEYGVKFKVNLADYLDTGLFLDHRETRQLIARMARSKRLLNLFAYTCSFSVHAAFAGAALTKSVDMSNTYCDWGRDNFNLNQLPIQTNEIVRADCLRFFDQELLTGLKYDLIVIDPPTISRSKKMEKLFDVRVDYIELIQKGLKLLLPGGTILFSTNSRKFQFDEHFFSDCLIKEISHKTVPIDFHDKKIHRSWLIQLLSTDDIKPKKKQN